MTLTSPLPSLDIRKLRTNTTLHGRSRYRPVDVQGHNVIRGYNSPGTGDAVDLFCPAGTEVRAMHAGTVTHIGERNGKLACVYLSGDHVLTVYAHLSIKPALEVGSAVAQGQCIGYVGRKLKQPHLHLELWRNGSALTARSGNSYRDRLVGLLSPNG